MNEKKLLDFLDNNTDFSNNFKFTILTLYNYYNNLGLEVHYYTYHNQIYLKDYNGEYSNLLIIEIKEVNKKYLCIGTTNTIVEII